MQRLVAIGGPQMNKRFLTKAENTEKSRRKMIKEHYSSYFNLKVSKRVRVECLTFFPLPAAWYAVFPRERHYYYKNNKKTYCSDATTIDC